MSQILSILGLGGAVVKSEGPLLSRNHFLVKVRGDSINSDADDRTVTAHVCVVTRESVWGAVLLTHQPKGDDHRVPL